MPSSKGVKSSGDRPKLVGVIASAADLRLAARMSRPPDLFELRLDCLLGERQLEKKARALTVPLIITARHSGEGGNERLSGSLRRDLLLRFLPVARYVDIELRSAELCGRVIERARRIGVSTIISFHDFGSTPPLGSLRAKASQAARIRADVFKVVTRTDTPAQLGRMLQFMSRRPPRLRICAMGMGRLGAVSRLLFAQCGSALIYTSLNESLVEGQVSFQQFREALRDFAAHGERIS